MAILPLCVQKSDAERHLHGVLATLSRCKATSQGNSSIMVKLINRRRRPGLNEACEVYEVDVSEAGPVSEDEDILNYDDVDDPDAYV